MVEKTEQRVWVRKGMFWSIALHVVCIATIVVLSTFAAQAPETVRVLLTLDPPGGGGGGGRGGGGSAKMTSQTKTLQEVKKPQTPPPAGKRRDPVPRRTARVVTRTAPMDTQPVRNTALLHAPPEETVPETRTAANISTAPIAGEQSGGGEGPGFGGGIGSGIGSGTGSGIGSGTGSGIGSGSGSGMGHSVGSGSGHGESVETLRNRYLREHFAYIRDLILKHLTYPSMAKKLGWQGNTKVSFVIKEDGRVEQLRIIKSSGYEVLDRNVVETIRDVQPFPRPPVRAQLVIPVVYAMRHD